MNEGWSGAKKTSDQSSDFAANFTTKLDEEYVIRFLDDQPYGSYRQHWIDRAGKRSFVCPEDPDDDKSPRCPLCDVGDKPRAQYAFNIALLDEKGKPISRSWDVGIKLEQKIERIHKDPRIGPLSSQYFSVVRTGKGGTSDTAITPIKKRDLYEDFRIDPLTDGEFEDMKRYTKEIIVENMPGMAQLKALAKELTKFDDRS